MSSQLLIDYLNCTGGRYSIRAHAHAYTAQEVAESSHIQGRQLAKVVMIKLPMELAMVVLPAHYHVELAQLAEALGETVVEMACEREFMRHFPRCEAGALPPFGHLFGVQTYMVPVFDEVDDVAFCAGSHTELIVMPFREYLRLAYVQQIPQGVSAPHSHGYQQAPCRPEHLRRGAASGGRLLS